VDDGEGGEKDEINVLLHYEFIIINYHDVYYSMIWFKSRCLPPTVVIIIIIIIICVVDYYNMLDVGKGRIIYRFELSIGNSSATVVEVVVRVVTRIRVLMMVMMMVIVIVMTVSTRVLLFHK